MKITSMYQTLLIYYVRCTTKLDGMGPLTCMLFFGGGGGRIVDNDPHVDQKLKIFVFCFKFLKFNLSITVNCCHAFLLFLFDSFERIRARTS